MGPGRPHLLIRTRSTSIWGPIVTVFVTIEPQIGGWHDPAPDSLGRGREWGRQPPGVTVIVPWPLSSRSTSTTIVPPSDT